MGLYFKCNCLAGTAHAKKYTCNASCENADGGGYITLNLDSKNCEITGGEVIDIYGSGEKLNLSETSAKMYEKAAYFDIQGDSCWAHYIRLRKQLLKSGSGYISLVSRRTGDTHDYSGYEYLELSVRLLLRRNRFYMYSV